MKMEDWIAKRMEIIRAQFGDKLNDGEYEYIVMILDSAWNRGNSEGRNEAFEMMRTWRAEERG
ncbi:transcriptional antiterminator [Paenibacillus sp. PastF-3]|uniref:hypothetical protein n=1 Tax=Paenibacillus sp. PastF-3 TaxID=2940626 RepID=UPI002476984A|nr:hypothetical protein [Paenibacillus sp. PastF-3]MDH6373564.1 transcriptional antiterminator [Paenibacillus sp. PastF-3]